MWRFNIIWLNSPPSPPTSQRYDQAHVEEWMQRQGTPTLVDLPNLKIVASDDGDELYVWWKED